MGSHFLEFIDVIFTSLAIDMEISRWFGACFCFFSGYL
jgi:hypothetical protein